jgi:hypothetical protein
MIRTKIARILSPTRVVLAAGAEHGVRPGMEFIIYDLSDPIFDPDTKEPLGQLELHKGRVKVIHIQDKLCTAATLPRKVYIPGLFEAGPVGLAGRWEEEHERLPIDQNAATAVEPDLTVKVGDLVRSTD